MDNSFLRLSYMFKAATICYGLAILRCSCITIYSLTLNPFFLVITLHLKLLHRSLFVCHFFFKSQDLFLYICSSSLLHILRSTYFVLHLQVSCYVHHPPVRIPFSCVSVCPPCYTICKIKSRRITDMHITVHQSKFMRGSSKCVAFRH